MRLVGALCTLVFFVSPRLAAQPTVSLDETLTQALEYRIVGPFRGGRSAAVSGVVGDRNTYYFGATGGGVWKSDDAGGSWRNISDGFFGGSIGAVAVSEWDSNVLYAGGGEKTVRGNVSHGYGMFKSLDAGKSWKAIGLEEAHHIPRIRIHPRNPDLVYAAVLGRLFGPSEQRGIYRSKDGGETWERILFANENAGAVDLVIDPGNPRILYASTWRVRRTPYSLESGGEGSALWKSTDGGDTWTDISRRPGMPEGALGIIGVAVSPVDPERVWAIIEADAGGVYRSDNGGETWRKTNDDRSLRQRAWYYTRLYADPQNADVVYVLNVEFWKSKDGGRTFESIDTPHSDHHDLWIDPADPQRMVIADDGGAQVSNDGGRTWSTYHNQPTAQFYRVTTDDHFPYRIYGAQQDNSTVRILSRSDGRAITEEDWKSTAGGESGHIAPHPEDAELVFGGSYGGLLHRLDHRTGESRLVNVWPDNPMGYGAGDLRYRFQWNYPLLFSAHDSNVMYAAANVLFRSTNEGQTWTAISPDLTRAEPSRMGPSGGPITKDNTSVEYYGTIFAVAESRHEQGVVWTGSDDGLIHLTRDGGSIWKDVTPPADIWPEWMMVNDIVVHPTEPGGVYVAGTRYKSNDFAPYLYKTTDYGRSWTKITAGIAPQHFTRAIEADPGRPGLLFAGTESGMYASFDDGRSWKSFQMNLPTVPITDLAIKDNDLIVATQGRSFWVLDDLTPLHQLNNAVLENDLHLLQPRPSFRTRGSGSGDGSDAGKNPPNGVVFHYLVREEQPDTVDVRFEILEEDGTPIRTYTQKEDSERLRPPARKGMNRFVWDMRYPDAERFDGLILWGGGLQGPRAVPGTYQARLTVGSLSDTVRFEILPDPRSTATASDYVAQFDFLEQTRDKLTEVHLAVKRIRGVREQIDAVEDRLAGHAAEGEIREAGKGLKDKLTEVEEALYQTKNRSSQDPLNYPIRLNNRLSALAGTVAVGDHRPTDQAQDVKEMLTRLIDEQLVRLAGILNGDVAAFNTLVAAREVPAVSIGETP